LGPVDGQAAYPKGPGDLPVTGAGDRSPLRMRALARRAPGQASSEDNHATPRSIEALVDPKELPELL